jgi:osmoprotectant transport system substrate-binding protein
VRRRYPGLFGVLLLLFLPACGGPAEPESDPAAATIRFASFDFQENQILVEVYAEGARRQGLPVSVQHAVGPREVVAPALQQGVVDVVVEYLGTALAFAEPNDDDLPREPAEMQA